jgi:hypothetical protein
METIGDFMTTPDTTMMRVDVDARNRLVTLGADITHNPDISANAALLALLGDHEQLKKRVKELERAMTRPAPVAA